MLPVATVQKAVEADVATLQQLGAGLPAEVLAWADYAQAAVRISFGQEVDLSHKSMSRAVPLLYAATDSILYRSEFAQKAAKAAMMSGNHDQADIQWRTALGLRDQGPQKDDPAAGARLRAVLGENLLMASRFDDAERELALAPSVAALPKRKTTEHPGPEDYVPLMRALLSLSRNRVKRRAERTSARCRQLGMGCREPCTTDE